MSPEYSTNDMIQGTRGFLQIKPNPEYSYLSDREINTLELIRLKVIEAYSRYISSNSWDHIPIYLYHGVYIDPQKLDEALFREGFDYFHENHPSCIAPDGELHSYSCSVLQDKFRIIHIWNFIPRDKLQEFMIV